MGVLRYLVEITAVFLTEGLSAEGVGVLRGRRLATLRVPFLLPLAAGVNVLQGRRLATRWRVCLFSFRSPRGPLQTVEAQEPEALVLFGYTVHL